METGFAITGIAVISSGIGISSAAADCIGTVAAFTASRSHLIVQPRLRD
jgi:hypothetical protein